METFALSAAAVPAHPYIHTLRTHVQVLTDPSYTAAARRLGLVTRTAPGAPHAAALVEQVAALGSTQHLSSPDNTGVVAAATATLAAVPLVLAALVLVCLARCLGGSGRRRVMKAKPE
mgnify:CR=1 FL=1